MSRKKSSVTRTLVFGGLVVAALLLVGGLLAGNLFNLGVPFTTETKDY